MNKSTIHIILFLTLMVIPQIKGLAQKTDTIVHTNGNILKGDFKKMEYGIVTWKMDGMGTISVEIPFVSTIVSQKQFEIVMKNGTIYYSSFEASDSTGAVLINLAEEKKELNIDDIVEIHPIQGSFLQRFSGNISLGGNFSKSSQLTTVAFSGNLQFRNKKTSLNTDWFLNLSYQNDSLITNNSEVNLNWQHLFENKWSSLVGLGRSQNLQLGIKERYNLTVGAIKDVTNTTWSRLYMFGGVTGISEKSFDTNTATQNDIAGLIRLSYDIFKYTNPKISLKSNISYIPYFTSDNRYRVSFNLNPNVSVFNNNFKVGFNFYYNYDSSPPASSLSNDDYGINLQLTYTLN
ncbi:DUF481 domain-containing protein [Robiginitalea aurantiaca]|uniref:DUF481 domain-containing protein n=1 Tax=Robiginitalea aurantiaca TaxID=3056915 RepID=A0ABT7WDB4_9FLAO|nr:DUF481 domain-containing protein [Robiginitalea aurantiaca]MDM9630896.1 DUF481 domain-containing protein [Robiginitalea aurantiaca]